MHIRPLHPVFVAEMTDIDPRNNLNQETFLRLAAALEHHGVLVFRGQPLDDERQIAFSRLFGSLETPIGKIRTDHKHRLRKELADISNLDENNNIRASTAQIKKKSRENSGRRM